MVFPVVMYGCESWTIKKAESQKIDAFELWCRRRFLRVPCTARRSNQSTAKEINSEYSLEGLKLKLQYFGHLMWRADSLEKILMLGKIEGKRRIGQKRMRCLDSITDSTGHESEQIPGESEGQGSLACCSPWGRKESDKIQQLNISKALRRGVGGLARGDSGQPPAPPVEAGIWWTAIAQAMAADSFNPTSPSPLLSVHPTFLPAFTSSTVSACAGKAGIPNLIKIPWIKSNCTD